MLSREQRESIERDAADQMRAAGTAKQGPVASAMVDIRHKVVEEGWYGRQVTDNGFYQYSQPQGAGIHGSGPGHQEGTGIHGNQASASDIYGHGPAQSPTAGVGPAEIGPTIKDGTAPQPVPSATPWTQASKDAAMGLGQDHAEKKAAAESLYGKPAEKKEAGMSM